MSQHPIQRGDDYVTISGMDCLVEFDYATDTGPYTQVFGTCEVCNEPTKWSYQTDYYGRRWVECECGEEYPIKEKR